MSTSFSVASWTEQITLPFLREELAKMLCGVAKMRGGSELPQGDEGEGMYEGFMTSKVLPSVALTNLLLMNKPVLGEISTKQARVEMEWGFTAVGMICRSEGESARNSQQLTPNNTQ